MPNIQELDVHSQPGFIILQRASGPPVSYPIADLLRAADIPTGLTHEQVSGLGIIGSLLAVLIRTLINRDVLNEAFADDAGMSLDLDTMIFAIEQLGGSYHEPNLDDVEDV